jgi:hypothetical protein
MSRWGVLAPAVLAVATAAVAIGVMLARREIHASLEAAFWALNVYSVLGAGLCAAAVRFWPAALVASLCWLVLFAVLPPLGRTIAPGPYEYGENSMILIVPMVLGPAALSLVGIGRFAAWVWARRQERQGAV